MSSGGPMQVRGILKRDNRGKLSGNNELNWHEMAKININ